MENNWSLIKDVEIKQPVSCALFNRHPPESLNSTLQDIDVIESTYGNDTTSLRAHFF